MRRAGDLPGHAAPRLAAQPVAARPARRPPGAAAPDDPDGRAQDVAARTPTCRLALLAGHIPTSVDLLAPGSPALELLASRPLAPKPCITTPSSASSPPSGPARTPAGRRAARGGRRRRALHAAPTWTTPIRSWSCRPTTSTSTSTRWRCWRSAASCWSIARNIRRHVRRPSLLDSQQTILHNPRNLPDGFEGRPMPDYAPPVAQLLTLGEPAAKYPDYRAGHRS